jgi:hypothetical protein
MAEWEVPQNWLAGCQSSPPSRNRATIAKPTAPTTSPLDSMTA